MSGRAFTLSKRLGSSSASVVPSVRRKVVCRGRLPRIGSSTCHSRVHMEGLLTQVRCGLSWREFCSFYRSGRHTSIVWWSALPLHSLISSSVLDHHRLDLHPPSCGLHPRQASDVLAWST
ncbi:hypothetical protein BV25DRAFT_377155 [Artomyces pyxidatus]|uniref:Uncharacterized protein n=1 Tax=Artomyces pyxidatus TaxID=48021 RepID=A0ACB8SE31_9AGAM|nr:hypothetical protein BV25DRAFT_377155 [Artomyces pyxidatus]